MTDGTQQTGQPTLLPDSNLTPEQFEAVKPLLQLAQIGTGQDLVRLHTPAQQRRAERKAAALVALRRYGTLERAAEAAGVARATLYRWRESDPAFEAEIKEWIDEDMEAELHDTLFTIAKRGLTDAKYANAAVRAAELLIRAENPDKYADRQKVESTLTINQQLQVVHSVRDGLRATQHQALSRVIDAEPSPAPRSEAHDRPSD